VYEAEGVVNEDGRGARVVFGSLSEKHISARTKGEKLLWWEAEKEIPWKGGVQKRNILRNVGGTKNKEIWYLLKML